MLNIFLNAGIFRFGGLILLAFMISLPISWLLSKISEKLIFAVPILLALLGILFLIIGALAESWGPVVFLVMGMVTLLAFVGAIASSVLLKVTRKENKK